MGGVVRKVLILLGLIVTIILYPSFGQTNAKSVASKEVAALQKENKALKEKLNKTNKDLTKFRNETKTLKDVNAKISKELTNYKSENKSLKAQLGDLKNLKDEISKIKNDYVLKDKLINSYEKEMQRLIAVNKELKENIRDLENGSGSTPPEPKPPVNTDAFHVEGLKYNGRTTYKSENTAGEMKNIHHYSLDIPNAHPINLYVTDNYIKDFGLGYAYKEIKDMMDAVEKMRDDNTRPYLMMGNSLSLVFYTNKTNDDSEDYQLPVNVQAVCQGNGFYGNMKSVILMNGGKMYIDFRTTLLHEIIHYYDTNEYRYKGLASFGYGGDFWYNEGAAEYGAYNYYELPKNTFNKLPVRMLKTREQILDYARQQGSSAKPLVKKEKIIGFSDIREASKSNYGVALSFYWYLVSLYGERKIQEYISYVDQQPVMVASDLEAVTLNYFGKTEQEILNGWMMKFPELF